MTIRIIVDRLIPGKIQFNSTLLASEAFTMPEGFTATELLVFVDCLSTTATLVRTICVDDRTTDGITSSTSLTICSNTTMGDTSMMTRSTINLVLASTAKEQTFVTRITEESTLTKILLTFAAIEAIKMIVLCSNNLVQKTTTLLLANRTDDIIRFARTAGSHGSSFRR